MAQRNTNLNLDKYKLPNFFIRKKYKNSPGTFNLNGNIYYVKRDGNRIKTIWEIRIDFPGRDNYLITKTSSLDREYFEDNFYHINRLVNWKKHAMIHAIFSKNMGKL